MKKRNRSKYISHVGIKELSKRLAKVLAEECKDKTPEERAELEAAFLARIKVIPSRSPVEPEAEKTDEIT